METNRFDFPSRVSIRGIAVGILTTFASWILLMAIVASLGIWRYRLNEMPNLGAGFWSAMFLVFVVSLSFGSFIASVIGRSENTADGLLHGVATWAGTCVLGCLALGVATGKLFDFASQTSGSGVFWVIAAGDAIALLAALRFGVAGARFGIKRVEEESRRNQPRAA